MFKKIITLTISALVLINVLPKTSALTSKPEANIITYQNKETGKNHKIYWTYGMNAPLMPGQNGYYDNETNFKKVEVIAGDKVTVTDIYYSAPFIEGNHWYGVYKDYDGMDNNFCSGVTAVNMLYWWMDLNQDYIKNFDGSNSNQVLQDILKNRPATPKSYWTSDGKHKSDYLVDYYVKGNKHIERTESDFLIDNFINGYRIESLPKDFNDAQNEFQTSRINKPENYKKDDKLGGFFYDVFGKEQLSTRDQASPGSYDNFSVSIKEALLTGKAVGIGTSSLGNGRHMISVWGAEYNENDELVALFISDNNSSEKSEALMRVNVYKPSKNATLQNPRLTTSTRFSATNADRAPVIDQLNTLSLGTFEWAKQTYPSLELPTFKDQVVGTNLSSLKLPEGWEWVLPNQQIKSGTNEYAAHLTYNGTVYPFIDIKISTGTHPVGFDKIQAESKTYDGTTDYNGDIKVTFDNYGSGIKQNEFYIRDKQLINAGAGEQLLSFNIYLTENLTKDGINLVTNHVTTPVRVLEATPTFAYSGNTNYAKGIDVSAFHNTGSSIQADGSTVSGTLKWYFNGQELTNEILNSASNTLTLTYTFTPDGKNKNYDTKTIDGASPVTFTVDAVSFTDEAVIISKDLTAGKTLNEYITLNPNLTASNGQATDKDGFTLTVTKDGQAFEGNLTAGKYDYVVKYDGTLKPEGAAITVESGSFTIKKELITLAKLELPSDKQTVKYNGTKEYTISGLKIPVNTTEANITSITGTVTDKNVSDSFKELTITKVDLDKNIDKDINLDNLTTQIKIAKNDNIINLTYNGVTVTKQHDGNSTYSGTLTLTPTGLVGDDTKVTIKVSNLTFESANIGDTTINLSKGTVKVYLDNQEISGLFTNYSGYTITNPTVNAKITEVPKQPEPSKPSSGGSGGGGHKGGGGGGGKKPAKPQDTSVVAPNVIVNSFDKNTRALKDTLENKFKSYSSEITKKYSDVTNMKNAMFAESLAINSNIEEENIVFFDLKVERSNNGKDWSSSNAKASLTIPYPLNSSINHDFVITHIKDDGTIEVLDYTLSEAGITFVTDSFSPFSVSWTEKLLDAYELTPAVTTIPATVIENTAVTVKETKSNLPLILGISVVVVALGSSAVIINKKKKNK